MHLQVHDSVERVPAVWDSIAPHDRVALDSHHLRAIERSGINALRPYYLTAHDDGRTVGIAYCFVMQMDMAFMQKDLPPTAVETLRAWHPDFLRLRLLECGLVSGLGEGMAADDAHFPELCGLAAREMERIAANEGAELVLVRDTPFTKRRLYATLIEQGYVPLMGFPIAMMPVRWASFDEHLADLKCATRHRLRRHLARESAGLEVETIDDFGPHAGRLAELWDKTHRRSKDYSHEELSEAYFYEMNRELPERSHVVAVKKDGQIVAFSLCLKGDTEYFSVHAGIDYRHSTNHNLYFVLSLALLKDAFGRGFARLNNGITTYDSKFEIGFEADPVVYFVKHVARPRLTQALAGSLAEAIKQPPNPHRPFKGSNIAHRPDLLALAADLPDGAPAGPPDVFAKIWDYDRINKFRLAGLYAFYPPFESAQGPTLIFKGRSVVMLGSNAYTGLGTHPEVVAAAKAAVDRYGSGCSGSPLLNGTLDIHVDLAQALAEFMQKEDALLFSTGYQTNVGVISALVGKDDVLVMDRLDHASLVDGARMAGAEVARFRHNDIASLERALRRHPERGKLVAVDSVFSMEGTVADLPTIVRLAKQHGARLMVDEAHAIGVLGPGGRGACEMLGVLDQVDVVMGTFSKSFAAIGGFVAGDARVIDYLRHVGRSHIFSASLPPAAVATVRAALEIIKREPERRRRALANAELMSRRLEDLGFQAPYRGTAIVPVHCGHELLAFGLFKKLLDEGVFVNPVAEPAVPRGRELLRTSYMATHTEEMLERALAAFANVRTASFPCAN